MLLGCLAMLVLGPGLLLGTDAGLSRSRNGPLGICAGTLMLEVPKVDGDLQLMPLARQAEALHLEACVDIGKSPPSRPSAAHCFLEKVMADDTAPACEFQRTTNPFFHARGCRRGAG